MSFPSLFPLAANQVATFASVATNSSALGSVYFAPGAAGEVVGARLMNSTTNAITSGTTTGSSASIVLYKTASSAGSVIATFNGSGTTVATNGTAALNVSGTAGSTNARFSAGQNLVVEFVGGAANNASNAGCYVIVDYVYGNRSGAAGSAATGPA